MGINGILCIDLENLVSLPSTISEVVVVFLLMTPNMIYLTSLIIDSCSAQWNDVKIAFKAKTASTAEEAKQILDQTHYKQHLGSDLSVSPTVGYIWELKEKPGWDDV